MLAMISNFFIWLVPGSLILGVSIIIIIILLTAAADIHGGSSKKDPFAKWPKGLIGFLGFGYSLAAISSLALLFLIDEIDAEGIVVMIFCFIVFALLGYWGIKYDYKRLINYYTSLKA